MSAEKTRILLVEDETDIGRIIQLAMPALGLPYELDFAMSAEEAKMLWSRQPYDLLLTDYNLRGMTGIDLIRYVHNEGFNIPTMLFTAYDSQAVRREAQSVGVSTYLAKPFFVDEFIERVRSLIPHKVEQVGGTTSSILQQ